MKVLLCKGAWPRNGEVKSEKKKSLLVELPLLHCIYPNLLSATLGLINFCKKMETLKFPVSMNQTYPVKDTFIVFLDST